MPTRTGYPCVHREITEALARDELSGVDREEAERHLEICQACRTLFRQLTVHRFPRIRNYTIVAELGRGGFGAVYKALHHSKERWEALKLLFGTTAQRTAYFENEVRLVAKLRHPNIATLYDANLHTTPLFYAMEFVQGQHLDDYFRSHGVSLEERIELVKTVTAAVGYAHRQGVVHRDLKPQNILIDPQGQPRIVDFGIAKRLVLEAAEEEAAEAAPHPAEDALGTYGYIAPEQLAGQNVDSRGDVYSLGALLFHVITGQPSRLAVQVDRLREILHERQVSRAEDLAAIIACCMRPLPEQRYPTCEAMIADLDNYLAGRPISARQETTLVDRTARLATLVLRNQPLAAQLTAVLVIAALAAAMFRSDGGAWLSGLERPVATVGLTLVLYACCAGAAVLVNRLPTPPRWLFQPLLVGVPLLLAAAFYVANRLATDRGLPLIIACLGAVVGSAAAAGAIALSIRLLRERQSHVSPGDVWFSDGTTTSLAAYRGGTMPSEPQTASSTPRLKREHSLSSAYRPRRQSAVPKVPRLIQSELDRLIEKGETDGLQPDEQAQLDEVLDYLDNLTIIELERLKAAHE